MIKMIKKYICIYEEFHEWVVVESHPKRSTQKGITILPRVTLAVWNLRLLPLMLKSDAELPEWLIECELQEMRSVE